MGGLRSLRNSVEKSTRQYQKTAPIVWAYMGYLCDDCHYYVDMYLENTLERHNGENHKPVPFMIRCPQCGGFHCYDRTGLIKLPEERPLKMNENYFKDDPNCDCGRPVIRGGKAY